MVTVTGNAGSTPVISRSARGTEWTQFSLASTRRVRGTDGAFYDGQTLWFKVKAWGSAAANIAASVTKGQPLVVTGRLEVDEWLSDKGPRTDLVITAESVGPNLMRGRTSFTRVVAAPEPPGAPGAHDPGLIRTSVRGQSRDPFATPLPVRPGLHAVGGGDVDGADGPDVLEGPDVVDVLDGPGTGADAAEGDGAELLLAHPHDTAGDALGPVGAGAGRDTDLTA